MSEMAVKHLMERIRNTRRDSPVAIFLCDTPKKLDCAFANTITTQDRILHKDPRYIGTFHGQHESRTDSVLSILETRFYDILGIQPSGQKKKKLKLIRNPIESGPESFTIGL